MTLNWKLPSYFLYLLLLGGMVDQELDFLDSNGSILNDKELNDNY